MNTGSCLCKGVTYTLTGPLRPICACHCLQCRKTSGHFVAATQAACEHIQIQKSSLIWYPSSDTAERGFCGTCGSNLFWRRFDNPNISIFAGSLDGETGLTLDRQIHVDSKGDYYDAPDVKIINQSDLK